MFEAEKCPMLFYSVTSDKRMIGPIFFFLIFTLPKPRFLNSATIRILGWKIFCRGLSCTLQNVHQYPQILVIGCHRHLLQV